MIVSNRFSIGSQWHIVRTSLLLLTILLSLFNIMQSNLFHNSKLSHMALWIYFEHHILCNFFSVVYHLVLLVCLIRSVRSSSVCSYKLMINLNSFSYRLYDVVNAQNENHLSFSIPKFEKLLLVKFSSISEEIAKN